jgi:hypothetical protein
VLKNGLNVMEVHNALQVATKGRMTKTEIMTEVFHKNIKAYELNEALRILRDRKVITMAYEAGAKGRPTQYVCYGTDGDGYEINELNPSRAYARYVDIAKDAVERQITSISTDHGFESSPYELNELNELSQKSGANAEGQHKDSDYELNELNELSRRVGPCLSCGCPRRWDDQGVPRCTACHPPTRLYRTIACTVICTCTWRLRCRLPSFSGHTMHGKWSWKACSSWLGVS